MRTWGGAAGVEGKRRFKNQVKGRNNPVTRITTKKKNNHLGPIVGKVSVRINAIPIAPMMMSTNMPGKKSLKGIGWFWLSSIQRLYIISRGINGV